MGNPFGDVKVHRTFTLFRLTIATAMPLRATGQSALPERPKIPNPGEKSGLGNALQPFKGEPGDGASSAGNATKRANHACS